MEKELPKVIIEKRRHRMYVTRNTEYHLKDDICVAVRKTTTGDWLMQGKALGARLVGTVTNIPCKCNRFTTTLFPEIGDNLLLLSAAGQDIVTTRVRSIERPPKKALKYYLRVA
jgi:hypothetical protein